MKKTCVVIPGHLNKLSNDYCSIMASTLEDIGVDAISAPGTKLSRLKFLGRMAVKGRADYLVVSWHENVLKRKDGRFSWPGAIAYFLMIGLFRLAAKDVIGVMHNFRPHDMREKDGRLAECVMKLGRKAFSRNICHSPHILEKGMFYIPHPLYESQSIAKGINQAGTEGSGRWIMFGRIEKYKNAVNLVRKLDSSVPLTIVGKCTDEALKEELINAAKGKDVAFKFCFIEKSKLDMMISESAGVVLAQQETANIVSGGFFHSISRGTRVMAVRSGFLHGVNQSDKRWNEGLILFDDVDALAAGLSKFNTKIKPSQRLMIRTLAELQFGKTIVKTSWSMLLKN